MKKLLLAILLAQTVWAATARQTEKTQQKAEPVKTVSADFNTVKGQLNRMFNECVGAGRANEGLRADWQQQLKYAKDLCGFRYIRMHGLLSDDMGVYLGEKDGKPVYNWQYIDVQYDYLLSIDVKPFVELSFMPNALASGDKTVFWWKGNTTPPKDFDKWADLVKNLVQHFKDRYGDDEVKTWYFEVWNEPNLGFYTTVLDDYLKLYQVTANAVKSVSKDYRVGGPATSDHKWVPEFIAFCAKNNVPVDYVSTHEYSTIGTPEGRVTLNKDPDWISNCVKGSRDQIKSSAKPGLELHYTEWNISWVSNDPILDTYVQAPFILDQVKKTGDVAQSMSFWTFTDIFEEIGPQPYPFHGGYGMINYQGIPKPAFYAYQLLNRLGDTELVSSDPSSWVCKDKNGNIQVLAWDYSFVYLGDSTSSRTYYKRDQPTKHKGKLQVKLASVPAGNYLVDVTKVGYRSNDPYTTYLDLGSPNQLTKQQVEAIKTVNNGKPESSKVIKIAGNTPFEMELPLREDDVYLVELKKLN